MHTSKKAPASKKGSPNGNSGKALTTNNLRTDEISSGVLARMLISIISRIGLQPSEAARIVELVFRYAEARVVEVGGAK